MDLRDEIQRIALESPSYGLQRITAELKRRGWRENHKRVYRILRGDNLLYSRRREFVVTTDSNHRRPVYPNQPLVRKCPLDITRRVRIWSGLPVTSHAQLNFPCFPTLADFPWRIPGVFVLEAEVRKRAGEETGETARI